MARVDLHPGRRGVHFLGGRTLRVGGGDDRLAGSEIGRQLAGHSHVTHAWAFVDQQHVGRSQRAAEVGLLEVVAELDAGQALCTLHQR